MKKKVLFAIALLSSAISFAQVAKESAIKAVEAKQKEFLTDGGLGKMEPKDKSDQFWIGRGKTIKYSKRKQLSASSKYKECKEAINKKNGFEIADFKYDTPRVLDAKLVREKSRKAIYEIVCSVPKCLTKLQHFNSGGESSSYDACYNLTMTWEATVKFSKNNESKIEKVELVLKSIKALPNADDELLANLNKELNRLIGEWYANNASSYFNSELQDDSILRIQYNPEQVPIQKINVLKRDVSISSDVPTIQVYVDPNKYMSPYEMYVNSPVAVYSFVPTFIVSFSEDYKKGELSVAFDKEFSGPKTLSAYERDEKEALLLCNQTKEEFFSMIESYKQNHTIKETKRLKSLFATNSTVDIAYNTQYGIKRKNRKFFQYVNRLKKVEIAIVQAGEPEVNIDAVPWTATVEYTQRASYGKKCDITNKRVEFVRDKDGLFKIKEIVVENDPLVCE